MSENLEENDSLQQRKLAGLERRLNRLAEHVKFEGEAISKPGEAAAITAFMGWLTSRDEVSGPFSARHEAGQAAQLVGEFCKAQGWAIDDTRWDRQIRVMKQKYPVAKDDQ